jgi:uncharacterized SAM-binding protein YcdF (DUF218 family)
MLKRIFRLLKYVLLLAMLIALAAYFYPEKFLCVDSGRVSGDVIVLLGGGVHERPLRAAELYKQHAASRIIITGQGDDEINREILIQNGVPAGAIEVENKSRTTQENAVNTLKLLRAEHVNRAILVTSWYHARRAERTFEHYGPDILFYSRPSYFGFATGDWKKTGTGKRMRLEFLKIPAYWIRFGISPF